MKKILVLLFAFVCSAAFAQKPPSKFGDIPMEDMNMKIYPKDSSASAVVLFDYGLAYISTGANSISLSFERHTRIKILTKEGLKEADVQVPLFHSGSNEETLGNLKAVTYNLEGGKIVETKLAKENVFKEDFNRNYIVKKFTLPNVKEGSIIEYSYRISSEFIANFPNWRFQRRIPTRLSEYWAMIPDIFFFEKYMQGYVVLDSYEANSTTFFSQPVMANHYVAKNVPAFKEEPYMTSEEDYISRINFALSHYQLPQQPVHEVMGSWEKLNELLLQSDAFGGSITRSGFLKDEVSKITAGISEPLPKVIAITNYVKQNFEWTGTKDYLADPLKKIFEKKKGTAADLNILLASMLDKADINVDMVLLSTRDHGFIRQNYPMEKQFNYVICLVKVGDKTLLLDATEKYLPYDVLPSRCLNGQGLKISKTNFGWIDIAPKAKEKVFTKSELTLGENGSLKGIIDFAFDGYEAQDVRETYFSKGHDTYAKEFMSDYHWTSIKNEFADVKEVDKSVKVKSEVQIDDYATTAGDVIYVNPNLLYRMEDNPFKSEKREFPVDYGNKKEIIHTYKLILPPGYVVDELPKSRAISMPDNAARYVFNISPMDNYLMISSNFQVNRILFTQDEYPLLREFYNQVVAKQAEQIVLKKK